MDTEQLQEGMLLNGRYRIRCALGQGGMGTVYMAEHVRLESIVAVKEVRGQGNPLEQFQNELHQVEQEARFLVHLNHPNLPKVNDAFIENERFYLVMEYIEGVTLEERLEAANPRPLDVEQAVGFALQIADVLYYLHTQEPPIIFRDLKPANIMVQPDDTIRLIDFGIARRFQPGASKDTSLLGSVGYSPPEQFGKHQTDPRSDIYAFGATLHHILTQRDPMLQPFKFPSARAINSAVPESLSRLLDECLSMDPLHRPQDMNQVAARLIAIHDELMSGFSTTTSASRASSGPMAGGHQADGSRIHPSQRVSSGRFGNSARVAGGHPSGRSTPSSNVGSEVPASQRYGSAASAQPPAYSTPASTQWEAVGRGDGSKVALVIVASLVLLFSGGLIVYKLTTKPVKQIVKPASAEQFPLGTTTPNAANVPTNTRPAPIPTQEGASVGGAEIQAAPQNIIIGKDGPLLPLVVTGVIHNHANENGTVAAFFYDENETPIQDVHGYPNSPYANTKGQLSVANSLVVTADNQPFSLSMSVPLTEFPGSTRIIKFRCKVFLGNDVVGQTEMMTVPQEIIEKAIQEAAQANENGGVANSGDSSGRTDSGSPSPRAPGSTLGLGGIGHP